MTKPIEKEKKNCEGKSNKMKKLFVERELFILIAPHTTSNEMHGGDIFKIQNQLLPLNDQQHLDDGKIIIPDDD